MVSCNELKRQISQQFLSRDNFILSHDMTFLSREVTLYHHCKLIRYCNGDTSSLTTCELLRHVASCCAAFIHLFHENLCSITF